MCDICTTVGTAAIVSLPIVTYLRMRVRQAICGLLTSHGNALRKIDHDAKKLYMECVCGWQSAGIVISDKESVQ